MQKENKHTKQKNNNALASSKVLRLHILIIGVFVLALYGKTINYDFIGLDEPTLIFDNYSFIKDFSNIPQAFKQHIFQSDKHVEGTKDYYRPMLTVSLMIDAQLSSPTVPQAKYFHLFNILYHIIACSLLLILLKQLNTPANVSLVLTLLFASHPILAQAVSWIPGRNDSLIAIFALLSFIYFLRLLQQPETKYIVLHLLFFLLALFSKESAISIVPLCFIYVFLFKKDFIKSKPFLFTAVGYILLAICWFLLRTNALKGAKHPMTIDIVLNALAENLTLLIQYIQKSILPVNLSVMSTVKDTNYLLGIVSLLVIGTAFYFSKKQNRMFMVFGLVWFLLFITPSLAAKFFEGLEHRIYLPLIGVILFVSRTSIAENFSLPRNKYILYGIVATFTLLTYLRLPSFANRLVYWESAIKNSQHSSLACLNLGKTYEMMGKYNEAIEAYREGLRRDSTQKLLHNNIGGAYIYMKMYDKAEVEILKEIEKHPDNNFADYNLGLIKKLQGKTDEAFGHFKTSVQKDTNFLQGYQQMADYYKKKNDTANFEVCIRKMQSLDKYKPSQK